MSEYAAGAQEQEFEPLNPDLYRSLQRLFGEVKVVQRGELMVRSQIGVAQQDMQRNSMVGRLGVSEHFKEYKDASRFVTGRAPESQVLLTGETYRVCCPRCGDTKFHLYVNYTFGMRDPATGQRLWFAKCHRCPKSVVPYLKRVVDTGIWITMRPKVVSLAESFADLQDVQDVFVSPGECVPLLDPDPKAVQARAYLQGRGIDAELAAGYGTVVCVSGNPDCYYGLMEGRIIIPVYWEGKYMGWQGRLSYDPPPELKDKGFRNLRYISMPGAGWRSRYVMGAHAALQWPFGVVVEGPLDMLRHGAPLVATMGLTLGFRQVETIGKVWSNRQAVIVLGDAQNKSGHGGNEDAATSKNALLLARHCVCPVYNVRLPEGDPGSWNTPDLVGFIKRWLETQPPVSIHAATSGSLVKG